MNNLCEISAPIAPFETGPENTIHFHCLMQRLQEAATAHAEREGFGISHLGKKNCFWVLTSIKVGIDELPVRGNDFTVTTWSRGAKRLRAFREFSCSDGSGREIVRASSEWMALDTETGKPLDINKLGLDLLPKAEKVFEKPWKRLRASEPLEILREIKVPYSVLDANGHVNNTEYLRWCMDEMRSSDHEPGKINSLKMSFLSELFEGDRINICRATADSEESPRMQIMREKDRKGVFALEVEYQKPV